MSDNPLNFAAKVGLGASVSELIGTMPTIAICAVIAVSYWCYDAWRMYRSKS